MKKIEIKEIYSITGGKFEDNFIVITEEPKGETVSGKLWDPKNPSEMNNISVELINIGGKVGEMPGINSKKKE